MAARGPTSSGSGPASSCTPRSPRGPGSRHRSSSRTWRSSWTRFRQEGQAEDEVYRLARASSGRPRPASPDELLARYAGGLAPAPPRRSTRPSTGAPAAALRSAPAGCGYDDAAHGFVCEIAGPPRGRCSRRRCARSWRDLFRRAPATSPSSRGGVAVLETVPPGRCCSGTWSGRCARIASSRT